MSTAISANGYKIYTGTHSLLQLQELVEAGNYTQSFILCDENTAQHCLPHLLVNCTPLQSAEIIEIESGEASKNMETALQLWSALTELGADRRSLLVNLGGGVITDLGGFIASLYKRGIDYMHVPTSLLAMADASVGGKNGVDFEGIKNHLGTITQPKAVCVDPVFLKTLPERQLANGWAEILKIALIADANLWSAFQKMDQLTTPGEAILRKSIALKNTIVKKDPYETDLRKILNFGHTIGHAVESSLLGSPQELLHGEAIVVGMIAEAWLSHHLKRLGKKELEQVIRFLVSHYRLPVLSTAVVNKVLDYLKHDKKNVRGQLKPALLNGIGACEPDITVKEQKVAEAIEFYNTCVG